MATIIFHPEAWINDYAVEVDPEGPAQFDVPDEEVINRTDDSYSSDDLRYHKNAPKWIADWSGPFWIEIMREGESQ